MSESGINNYICSTTRWSRTGSAPFLLFHVDFFWRTRAVVVGHLGVGGKVTAAGFPGPRGGPGFRRAGVVGRSCPIDVREETDERLRDQPV